MASIETPPGNPSSLQLTAEQEAILRSTGNIRINAVAPGAILTEALAMVSDQPEILSAIEEGTPLRRIGTPDDIAAAVLYLASDAASYTTGAALNVDGGYLCS